MASEQSDKSSNFSLTSTSQLFSERSNDIFAGLDALEQKHNVHQKTQASSKVLEHAGYMKVDPVEDEEDTDRRDTYDSSRQRDSRHHQRSSDRNDRRPWRNQHYSERNRNYTRDGFRRPRHIPFKAKKAPDFEKHPEKWTCYSLDDVSETDLSERSNKKAALDFLMQRKEERERQERLAAGLPEEEEKFDTGEAACSKGLISFSRKKTKEKKMESGDKHLSAVGVADCGNSFNKEQMDEMDTEYFDCGQTNSSSKLSVLEPDSRGDSESDKVSEVSTLTFKQRKNVRKQIRRKESDETSQDKDDE